jgi:hypothetical protein
MKKFKKEEFREVFTYENFKGLIVEIQELKDQVMMNREEMKEIKD